MADGMDDEARMHIRNAMVLIAGIKMMDADNPRGLWTALEDAYDELSEAIGSDGDVGKDEEEAKARGRCVVVPSNGNTEKMREALEKCANMGEQIDCQLGSSDATVYAFRVERCLAHNISEIARAALVAPARNCDIGTAVERAKRYHEFCRGRMCETCPAFTAEKDDLEDGSCIIQWEDMPYEEGGKDGC